MKKNWVAKALFPLCLFTLPITLALLSPHVSFFGKKGLLFRFPLYLGDFFVTEYIHSVQLCPVKDFFCADRDRLWLWEESTQSTNAGLPTEAPYRGHFIHEYEGPWYRFVGGGRSLKRFLLRVGNRRWGKNLMFMPEGKLLPLYQLWPNERLLVRVF